MVVLFGEYGCVIWGVWPLYWGMVVLFEGMAVVLGGYGSFILGYGHFIWGVWHHYRNSDSTRIHAYAAYAASGLCASLWLSKELPHVLCTWLPR